MRKRILIVDDDAAVGEALRRVLAATGYEVVWIADGEAGVSRLQQEPFDLLLLDLNLPKVSGFDILDLVGERYPCLPVLILTGQLEHCEPGALSGADVLLEKPPDVTLLLKTVEGLLSESAATRLRRLGEHVARARALPRLGRGHLKLPKLPVGFGGGSASGSF